MTDALGYDADLTLVDLGAKRTITEDRVESTCGWTPFDGMECRGWPMAPIIRGRVVIRDGELAGTQAGKPLVFTGCLP